MNWHTIYLKPFNLDNLTDAGRDVMDVIISGLRMPSSFINHDLLYSIISMTEDDIFCLLEIQ